MFVITLCFGALNAQNMQNVEIEKLQQVLGIGELELQSAQGIEDGNLPVIGIIPEEQIKPYTQEEQINPWRNIKLRSGTIAYANLMMESSMTNPTNYVSFDIDDPTNFNRIGPNLASVSGGAFYKGILYVAAAGGLRKYDSPTGTLIETIPAEGAIAMSAMSYDYSQEILYGISATRNLFTIDIETGMQVLIGPLTVSGMFAVQTLAIDLEGNMFAIQQDASNAPFYSINKETGECTLVGLTGVAAGGNQSMGFDYNTGILYWMHNSAALNFTNSNFKSIDPETGVATQIASISPGVAATCFHIPYYQGGCPPVTNLEYELQENNDVLLTWTAIGNPIEYKIYNYLDEIATVTETECLLENQKPGIYSYSVAAVYDSECEPVKTNLPTVTVPFLGTETLAYGNIILGTPLNYGRWDVEEPSYIEPIGPGRADLYGNTFYNGLIYGYTFSLSTFMSNFVIIDARTGALLKEIQTALYLTIIQDMSYDYTENVMYGIFSNSLYTIDLNTGIPTLVKPINGVTSGTALQTFAINLQGEMYAIESTPSGTGATARLLKIDKTTGDTEFIGYTGFYTYAVHSMAFDHNTGTLYWAQAATAAAANPESRNFMKINIETGAAELIYNTGNQVTGLHFYYFDSDACPGVTNLSAEVTENDTETSDDVFLTWTASQGNPIGYIVYDGLEELATVTETEILLVVQAPGSHLYGVAAKYDNDCNTYTEYINVTLASKINNPPFNFEVVQNESCSVKLTWLPPLAPPAGSSATLVSYSLYCDDVLLATIPNVYYVYSYMASEAGNYKFSIAANYSNDISSVKINRTVSVTCDAVNNYTVSNLSVDIDYSSREVSLSWFDPTLKLWDNMNCNPTATGTTIGYWTISENGIYAADDFYASGSWNISYIRTRIFIMNNVAETANPEKWAIAIYKNTVSEFNGYNVPGEQVYFNENISKFAMLDSTNNGTSASISYLIKLPEPFELSEGGIYWVSIAPSYDVEVNTPSQSTPYRFNIYMGSAARMGYNFCVIDENQFAYSNYPQTVNWTPYISLVSGLTQTSIQFAIEKTPNVKYNVYMDGVKIGDEIEETSLFVDGIDISQDHLFCVRVVDENGVEGEDICVSTDFYLCNTVGSTARVVFDEDCTEATITWPAAVGENTLSYRIVFNDQILADNIPNTAADRRYVHTFDFENGETYSWEIYTLCGLAYSDPRTVSATAVFVCNTVGEDASADFNDDCTKATITWTVAAGIHAQAYRIMFEGNILQDNIQNTEYEHVFDFEYGETYSWEIITICEFGYSESRTVTANADCSVLVCETVGEDASAEINDACAKATITWSVTENAKAYRIMFDGNILEDNILTTEYEHIFDFESGETYSWEIITICDFGISEPRTITATANCVGINKLIYNLIVYPNPASTSVIIEGADIEKVEVFNMLGYSIDTKTGRIKSVDVSGYRQGQYIFKLYDVNNNFVIKLITVTK